MITCGHGDIYVFISGIASARIAWLSSGLETIQTALQVACFPSSKILLYGSLGSGLTSNFWSLFSVSLDHDFVHL